MDIAKGCVQFNLVDYVDFLKKVLRATETLSEVEESEINKWKNDIINRSKDLKRVVTRSERQRLAEEFEELKDSFTIAKKARRLFDFFKKQDPEEVVKLPTQQEYLEKNLTDAHVDKLVLDATATHGSVDKALMKLSYDYRKIVNDRRYQEIHKDVQMMFGVAKTTDNATFYLPIEQVNRLSKYIRERDEVNAGNNFFVIDAAISERGNSYCHW
jgi:hypothetical protein